MALAAALVRAAAPMLLRGREAPCSAPALHPRRLLSCSTTSDAPPPPARPLASKLAEPESQLPWREAQAEILRDIEPVVQLIKDILHSDRYGDGECVTSKDEIIIVEKLLAYHPRAEDKIGCGLDAIMVLMYCRLHEANYYSRLRKNGSSQEQSQIVSGYSHTHLKHEQKAKNSIWW
ncbi:uncharacterized protein [Lolium perenne]|uniref:uncharacterized protein isoform X2 n=1 Tax=Lolium perenne TaxID=4522 RepID=UPI003A99FA97